MIRNDIFEKLRIFCNENKIDVSHGYGHYIAVYEHAKKAIDEHSTPISEDNKQAILYAALLHDVDDHKFFPKNINHENARKLLKDIPSNITNMTLYMISLVSCSVNGNSQKGIHWDWLLIPRIADRLEAIGNIGIERVIAYGEYIKRPMHTDSTLRCLTKHELDSIATDERFQSYLNGTHSNSTLDHFYDKLLHIGKWEKFGIENPYLIKMAKKRHEEIIQWVLYYWQSEADKDLNVAYN